MARMPTRTNLFVKDCAMFKNNTAGKSKGMFPTNDHFVSSRGDAPVSLFADQEYQGVSVFKPPLVMHQTPTSSVMLPSATLNRTVPFVLPSHWLVSLNIAEFTPSLIMSRAPLSGQHGIPAFRDFACFHVPTVTHRHDRR